jgi:hypothetical protein
LTNTLAAMVDDNILENFSTMTTIPITAPLDLTRGFVLEVEIDGKMAQVVVPYDVREGEIFEGTRVSRQMGFRFLCFPKRNLFYSLA